MSSLKNIKKRIWAFLSAFLCVIFILGINVGSYIRDIEASKNHVQTHPGRVAYYNSIIAGFNTTQKIFRLEIDSAKEHRNKQDLYMREIVHHLSELQLISKSMEDAENQTETDETSHNIETGRKKGQDWFETVKNEND